MCITNSSSTPFSPAFPWPSAHITTCQDALGMPYRSSLLTELRQEATSPAAFSVHQGLPVPPGALTPPPHLSLVTITQHVPPPTAISVLSSSLPSPAHSPSAPSLSTKCPLTQVPSDCTQSPLLLLIWAVPSSNLLGEGIFLKHSSINPLPLMVSPCCFRGDCKGTDTLA